MDKKIASTIKITQWSKICYIRLMRSVIIEKASQDEQQVKQQQRTFNTFKTLCSFIWKDLKKVKLASDKIETKTNNLRFICTRYGTSPYLCPVTIRLKGIKTSLIILKSNNFKILNIIRYQLKSSNRFMITYAPIGGQKDLSLLKFLCGKEKINRKRQQTKVQLKFARKRCRSRKATSSPSKYLPQTNKTGY